MIGRRSQRRLYQLIFVSIACYAGCAPVAGRQPARPPAIVRPASPDPACEVQEVKRTTEGLREWTPNGNMYVANRKDETGIYQLYVARGGGAETCITCVDRPDAPKRGKHKIMPQWHPSGRWIFVAVERDSYAKPIISTKAMIEGMMAAGLFVNMYATRPDGSEWHRMSDFGGKQRADGYTGPAFTPDGRRAVWAQIVDGNIFQHLFGRWELILADFSEDRGVPQFTQLRNITPTGARWVEPGNFAPDGRSLLLSADIGLKDPQGQDQFVLDVFTKAIRNLNRTPGIWDEHGMFSPDGGKILFMSSYPYRQDPFRHSVITLKTEFMLMNPDGTGLQQLTHFLAPGYPEYDAKNGLAANGEWHPDGRSISAFALQFPEMQSWTITFRGNCGARGLLGRRM